MYRMSRQGIIVLPENMAYCGLIRPKASVIQRYGVIYPGSQHSVNTPHYHRSPRKLTSCGCWRVSLYKRAWPGLERTWRLKPALLQPSLLSVVSTKPVARNCFIQADIPVAATCFFLGILFAYFPYDYNVLWATPVGSREPYFDSLEDHLKFIHQSPPLISRVLHIVIGVGLIGFITKLYKPSEANMLFDGASLVLYMCGVTVYIANIVKGLRIVTKGGYGHDLMEGETQVSGETFQSAGRTACGSWLRAIRFWP